MSQPPMPRKFRDGPDVYTVVTLTDVPVETRQFHKNGALFATVRLLTFHDREITLATGADPTEEEQKFLLRNL
jgi:hypothetical protein